MQQANLTDLHPRWQASIVCNQIGFTMACQVISCVSGKTLETVIDEISKRAINIAYKISAEEIQEMVEDIESGSTDSDDVLCFNAVFDYEEPYCAN